MLATPENITEPENVAGIAPEDTTLVVAFASLEGDMVDQHFGSSQAFYVYDVSDSKAELLTHKRFAKALKDGNEDKLIPKLKWLVGCDIVYCGSIGGSATRQLISLGVTPKKVSGGPDVDELIGELQKGLSANSDSEFWLTNILRKKNKLGSLKSEDTSDQPAFVSSDDEEDWS